MGRRTLVVRLDSQVDFAIRAGHHDRQNAQTRILQLEGQYEGNMETNPYEAAPLNPFKRRADPRKCTERLSIVQTAC